AEHNGTFRGNNLAFIAATEALSYWEDDQFTKEIDKKAELMSEFVNHVVSEYKELKAEKRGRGLMQGVACGVDDVAVEICGAAFDREVLIDSYGASDEVLNCVAMLANDEEGLKEGLDIIGESRKTVLDTELGEIDKDCQKLRGYIR